MQIAMANGTLTCELSPHVTANYIKDMVGEIKNVLEGNDDYESVCINMEKVDMIDSLGITFLIGIYKTCIKKDKKVALIGYNEAILQIFKIMKLDEIFELSK
jgi:anti-anti-sigma factor